MLEVQYSQARACFILLFEELPCPSISCEREPDGIPRVWARGALPAEDQRAPSVRSGRRAASSVRPDPRWRWNQPVSVWGRDPQRLRWFLSHLEKQGNGAKPPSVRQRHMSLLIGSSVGTEDSAGAPWSGGCCDQEPNQGKISQEIVAQAQTLISLAVNWSASEIENKMLYFCLWSFNFP